MKKQVKTLEGTPLPFGVSSNFHGHNFAIYSRNATSVTLQLYWGRSTSKPRVELELDPTINKTGDVWHIQVSDLPNKFTYTYKIDGPYDPKQGQVFDKNKFLIDPYAKAIAGLEKWGKKSKKEKPLRGHYEELEYDWEGDKPLNLPWDETIIYELHTRGFSKRAKITEKNQGTYRGIIDKIPYLKQLGVTAIELMPLHDFDENDCPFINPLTNEPLHNYWGYSTINFFALKTGYASVADCGQAINEFKDMVKALHAANIEVIIDVVFNHTAEGGREGKILNFKGFENSVYYIQDSEFNYKNYSGCGNTMNCNHPVVRQMIRDSLRYWVTELHVDGFRFDLASILGRDEDGNVLPQPPILESIAKDPILSKTKIIAEAWDAAGLYQVGSFPASKRWAEWNGRYRDVIRRFCTGEQGVTGEMATRIAGSEDLYRHSERNPYHSINFITAHDGYTMMDLVSYTQKNNYANGEDNRDGSNHCFSMNFGVEGATNEESVILARKRQIRNMATILMISQGTPMLLAGDEFGRTQMGNNNAWCQDNEISWINWDQLKKNEDLFKFWQKIIQFRKNHPCLRREKFFTGEINPCSEISDISWHNVEAYQPDFHGGSDSLAFMIDGKEGPDVVDDVLYVAMNFSQVKKKFALPKVNSKKLWRDVLCTDEPRNFIQGKRPYIPPEKEEIEVPAFSIRILTKSY